MTSQKKHFDADANANANTDSTLTTGKTSRTGCYWSKVTGKISMKYLKFTHIKEGNLGNQLDKLPGNKPDDSF